MHAALQAQAVAVRSQMQRVLQTAVQLHLPATPQVQLPPQGVPMTFTPAHKLKQPEAHAVVRHFAEQFGINLVSPRTHEVRP